MTWYVAGETVILWFLGFTLIGIAKIFIDDRKDTEEEDDESKHM